MTQKADTPDWDTLEFRHYPTDAIYRALGAVHADPPWDPGKILPGDTPLELLAQAAVLSYGCGIIEGLKAERTSDGRILLFRPTDHGQRFHASAERLLMLPFPVERFVWAVEEVVKANLRLVPPAGKGTFYLRPMQHAIEPMLGLRRASQFAVTIYGSPVGAFGGGPTQRSLKLQVLRMCRAAPGGTGAAKAIGNYPGTLQHKEAVRAAGFDDVLYLDAAGKGLLQETSGANLLVLLRSGVLVSPHEETILSGITRDSALRLAERHGIRIERRPVPLQEVLAEGVECFCAGTAWTLRSVSQLSVDGRSHTFARADLAQTLREQLRGIQCGAQPDPFGWTQPL